MKQIPKEFDEKRGKCGVCGDHAFVVFLKAAHVPIYEWVCLKCRKEWVED